MKGILVNIFGGIMRCDIIAEGVIAAVKEVGLKVPLVVRLEGTNVELGKKIIDQVGAEGSSADDLDDAAQKIVAACEGRADYMAILVDKDTKILVQGITGKTRSHSTPSRRCATTARRWSAASTPGKAARTWTARAAADLRHRRRSGKEDRRQRHPSSTCRRRAPPMRFCEAIDAEIR